jgi:hypothetical protein
MEANYVRKLETRQSKSNDIRESRDQDEVDRTQTAYRIGQIPGAGNLQTHLLHHNFGSGSLSACCNFENGVVTRFFSIRAELKIGSACA